MCQWAIFLIGHKLGVVSLVTTISIFFNWQTPIVLVVRKEHQTVVRQ